ncbi:MAG: nitroreductase family protein [Chloroflexi bacterium]|nr:MAG: nitroreductase family protein [Chloroflexota bacterium]
MDAEGLFVIIHSRRSIRRYDGRPVPADVLRRVLESGRWAPSAHNRQPWRFAVVTNSERQVSLARAMGARFREDLAPDGLPAHEIERQVSRSYTRITEAPALVLVCLSLAEMDTYPDARRQDAERIMAVQSTALAAQNILLMAHAEGLGACWMCAPLFCPEIVREELNLPPDWEAQALLTLGYTAEQRTKDRDTLESKIVWY